MFCHTCGAEGQSPNAYCKRCGEWLPDLRVRHRFGGETPQQKIFTSLFMSALSALAALFSAIALYATYLGAGEAKWSVYAAAAICVCIAGWQASSFFVAFKLRQRLKSGREGSTAAAALESEPATPVLNAANMADFVSPPTVTESTSRHLVDKNAR